MVKLTIAGIVIDPDKISAFTFTDETGRKNDKIEITVPDTYSVNNSNVLTAVINNKMDCGRFTVSRIRHNFIVRKNNYGNRHGMGYNAQAEKTAGIYKNADFRDCKKIATENKLNCIRPGYYQPENFDFDTQRH